MIYMALQNVFHTFQDMNGHIVVLSLLNKFNERPSTKALKLHDIHNEACKRQEDLDS